MSDTPPVDPPPSPPPVFAPPTVPGEIPRSHRDAGGLAIGSMITGVSALLVSVFGVFCVISPVGGLAGLVAVILGWVSLAKKRQRRKMAWTGVITGVLAFIAGMGYLGLFAYIVSAGAARSASSVNSAVSQANARSIGLGLIAYAANNQDALPPAAGWERAVLPYIGGGVSLLPASPNALGVTPSYIYVPAAKLSQANPGRVLLYENPAFSTDEFAVVYTDGHVENKSRKQLEEIVAKLDADSR